MSPARHRDFAKLLLVKGEVLTSRFVGFILILVLLGVFDALVVLAVLFPAPI
jgi:hypothetical protein